MQRFKVALQVLTLSTMAVVAADVAHAQEFPTKPIRAVVPYAAGGTVDAYARIIGQRASARLGQPVLVENRAGANATIGATAVAKASADGYTVGFMNLAAVGNVFNKTLTYDTDKDFEAVSGVYKTVYALGISTAIPARTLKEFIDYVKANPGKLNFGAQAITSRLTMEMLMNAAGMKMEAIQYKGTAPAMQALLVNEIQAMFDSGGTFNPVIQQGKARVIAVTGDRRLPQLPDVPSMAEAGFNQLRTALSVSIWVPAGTPSAVVARLNAAMVDGVQSPEFKTRVEADGSSAFPSTPEEARASYRAEQEFWSRAAKLANFEPQ